MHVDTGWLIVTLIWAAALVMNVVQGNGQMTYFCIVMLCVFGTLTLTT